MSASSDSFTRRGIRLVALSLVLVLPLIGTLAGCDQQLEEQSFDQITPNNFFQNEDQFLAAATGVYSQLRGIIFDPLDSQEHTSDELMVPTRGPDWGDGGIWRDLTQHNFNPNTPQIGGAWSTMQVGVARANGVLSSLAPSESIPADRKAQFESEVRFLRAFYYYWLMDQFGGVPIVVEEGSETEFATQPVDPNDPPARNSRAEVFDFILQELTGCTAGNFSVGNCIENPGSGTVIGDLAVKGEVPFGRATKEAALAMTARLLLNAEVYSGEVTQGGINSGTALYEGAAAAADRVINSGRYQLAPYLSNFSASNQTSEEIIFAATFAPEADVGFEKQQAFLHYNHPVGSTPWNGFTSIAEFYKSYNHESGTDGTIGTEDDVHTDVRGKSFLVGKQYQAPAEGCSGDECFSDPNSGKVTVRGEDTQLNLTLDIPSIRLGSPGDLPDDFPATSSSFVLEAPGARPLKFEIDPSREGSLMGNDFPLFRLAEMYLIKAEAEAKLGNMGAALDAFNEVHTDRGNDPLQMADVSGTMNMIQYVIEERGRELLFEGTRRSDLIRYEFAHGGSPVGPPYTSEADPYVPTFTAPWLFKKDGSQSGQASEAFRAVFPIPQTELSTNPNLTQNPGY